MYAAVKLHLVKALEDSKLAKKDKWVKDNAGQCVIRYVLRSGLSYLLRYNYGTTNELYYIFQLSAIRRYIHVAS
jgi:hypothetical protein